eukprot:scaffold6807_cov220-Amphora_coffeaeformis.AAC.14
MKERAFVVAENQRLKRKLDSLMHGTYPQNQSNVPLLETNQVETQPRRVSMECTTGSTTPGMNGDVPGSTDIYIQHHETMTNSTESETFIESKGCRVAGGSAESKGRGKAKHAKKKDTNVHTTIPWKKRSWDPKKFYIYPCPVSGCSHEFAFAKKLDPPLTKDGTVADDSFWQHKKFRNCVQKVRDHMRNKHGDFDEGLWPAGFAFVVSLEKRRKSMTHDRRKVEESISNSIRTNKHRNDVTVVINGLELLAKEADIVAAVLKEMPGDSADDERSMGESTMCGLDFS